MHPPFSKKGDPGLAKNDWVITLTSIVAKIYNARICKCIEPKIEKILRKNQNWSMTSQILTICWILEGVSAKNLEVTILFVDFAKAFDSIHRRKMEQILLTYDLLKETVAAIMMLYIKKKKVKVCSLDGDTDYFDIVAGVLLGDILTPYLFIICLDYMLRSSIDKMKEADEDYIDDIALLADTSAQAETLLYSLEWATAGTGLHVNADKTEHMCFNQRCNTSTLLEDKFTYLGSSVSSTCD